jgi:hypothetical protein
MPFLWVQMALKKTQQITSLDFYTASGGIGLEKLFNSVRNKAFATIGLRFNVEHEKGV